MKNSRVFLPNLLLPQFLVLVISMSVHPVVQPVNLGVSLDSFLLHNLHSVDWQVCPLYVQNIFQIHPLRSIFIKVTEVQATITSMTTLASQLIHLEPLYNRFLTR